MTVEAMVSLIAGPTVLVACLLALIEKFLPILPSSALLIFLGMKVVAGPGDLALVLAATTLGSSLGCLCLYAAGRIFGETGCAWIVARYGPCLFLSAARYERLVERYRYRHFPVTLLGQTVPAARAVLPLSAGMFGMAPGRFMLAVALGASIWNGAFLTVGYILHLAA